MKQALMNSVAGHRFPFDCSLKTCLFVLSLTPLLLSVPAHASGSPAVPVPGTGPDARWNSSSLVKPAAILGDYTWFEGHSDPINGNIHQYYALDIEQDVLFAATGQGIEIHDLSGGPNTGGADVYLYGTHRSDGVNAFPFWEHVGDSDWFVKYVDAPKGNSHVVALSMDIQGFVVINVPATTAPVVAYQSRTQVAQVYAVRIAGADYAYAMGDGGTVFRYNMSAAATMNKCLDTIPGVSCPGVYKGQVTTLGAGIADMHGVGNFLATGKWLAGGSIKIYSISDPAAPAQVLQIAAPAMGLAMWQSGSSYYLARMDAQKKLTIHDVSCIAGGSCSSAPVVFQQTLASPSILRPRHRFPGRGQDLPLCRRRRSTASALHSASTSSTLRLRPSPPSSRPILPPRGYWGWYYQAVLPASLWSVPASVRFRGGICTGRPTASSTRTRWSCPDRTADRGFLVDADRADLSGHARAVH